MNSLNPLSEMLIKDGAKPVCGIDFIPIGFKVKLREPEDLPIRDAWQGDYIKRKGCHGIDI